MRRVAQSPVSIVVAVGAMLLLLGVTSSAKENLSVKERVAALEALVADLTDRLEHFSRDGDDIYIEGANLHVVNGTDSTDGLPNGLGNVIIGYNEERPRGVNDRSGSHMLVMGMENDYSEYGGIIVGYHCTADGEFASVVGGTGNHARGMYSTISGGAGHVASGDYSTVSGGDGNQVLGDYSAVSGGADNRATGDHSTVSGGLGNEASGPYSSISGGVFNTASGLVSSVSGGIQSKASGLGSTVSGGRNNVASGDYSSIAGGAGTTATGTDEHPDTHTD